MKKTDYSKTTTADQQELINRRLAGELPRIDIGGRDFIIDWGLRELRCVDNPGDRIELCDLPMDADGTNYLCFYNSKLRQTVIPDIHMTALPKNVVVLTIPYELKLDPVAVARDLGMKETDLLKDFPIEPGLKVTVTPIEETEMVQLVKRNQNKQWLLGGQQRHNKRRKGKGL